MSKRKNPPLPDKLGYPPFGKGGKGVCGDRAVQFNAIRTARRHVAGFNSVNDIVSITYQSFTVKRAC